MVLTNKKAVVWLIVFCIINLILNVNVELFGLIQMSVIVGIHYYYWYYEIIFFIWMFFIEIFAYKKINFTFKFLLIFTLVNLIIYFQTQLWMEIHPWETI
jgi:hypothetical protein